MLCIFTKKTLPYLLVSCFIFNLTHAAKSEDEDFLKQTKISGNIRLYDFNRNPSAANTTTQNAFALGGSLDILTGPILPGLKAGATAYTSQRLGNSSHSAHTDNTLPGFALITLGQAFLQYEYKWWFIKAGTQTIDTPWLNSNDSRMIPATYEGVYTTVTPIKDLSFIGLRTFRFKGRVASAFSPSNLYNTMNIGGSGIAGFANTPVNGALAFGSTSKAFGFENQAWLYEFYDMATLAYGESKYKFTTQSDYKPYINGQVLREWGDGKNMLANYAGGNANAAAFGVQTGLDVRNMGFNIAYNTIPVNNDSFKNGNILSPYTTGYATDPLYTSSMIAGLVEKSSGQAVKLSSSIELLDKHLRMVLSWAKYYTEPRTPNTEETDFDITYKLSGVLKGLSLRNRIGVMNGNPAFGRFIYNRVMMQYSFGK